MALELVLFDLDGTLVDSLPDISAGVNHVLSALGHAPLDPAIVRTLVGEGVTSLLGRALGTTDESLLARARALFLPHYQAHCVEGSALVDGAIEALDAAPRAALLTNKPRAPTLTIVDRFGIRSRFAVIIAGDDSVPRKPDPAPIRVALESTGASARGALMVGDGPTDVRAAKAAGVRSCAVLGGYAEPETLRALGPDYVATSLFEVAALLRRLRS